MSPAIPDSTNRMASSVRGRIGSVHSGPSLPVFGSHVRGEDALAEAQRAWSDLQQLVLANPFESLLERQLAGRQEMNTFLRGGGAHVGELLLADDVDVDVFFPRVLAQNHALVHARAGLDEDLASVLHLLDRIGGRLAGAVGHQRARHAMRDLALPRLVAIEQMIQQAGAAGVGEELAAEADQPAR